MNPFRLFTRKPRRSPTAKAASELSRLGHAARARTQAEKYNDFHNRLRAEMAAKVSAAEG